jgi:uncharacterized membrane protein
MTRTIVALYEDIQQAHTAVRDLTNAGINRENISLVSNDAEGTYSQQLDRSASDTAENVGKGAGAGAVLGGLGGLVVGLGALAIPGIGPIVAAGPLATTLAGAGIGAAAGGLVGALVDLGIPEEQAQLYTEGIRRGGTLVTVLSEDSHVDRVIDILNHHNPIDIERHRSEWTEKEDYSYQNDPGTHVQDTTGTETHHDYEQQWRSHFQQTNRQGRFEDYQPAYRYGHELSNRENFRNRGWMDMEREVQLDWEQRNPDYPYNDYREYIRSGWESSREIPKQRF